MFYRLVQSSLTCTCFDVGANKNPHNFSGRARDTGKLKKQRNFWLPRRRKKFLTLADYVIPRNYLGPSLKPLTMTGTKCYQLVGKPLYSMWCIDTLHLDQSELDLWRNHRGSQMKFSQHSKRAIGSRKSSKRGESKECLLLLLETK